LQFANRESKEGDPQMEEQKTFTQKMIEQQEQIEYENTLEERIIEGKEVEAEMEQEQEVQNVFDLIEQEHGVDRNQIEMWKQDYAGKVFVSRFDENEAYIFRYVALPEWKQILAQIQKSSAPNKDELLDELIFAKCVLYPKVTDEVKATVGAGTIPTVALQIKIASNFIHESVAVDMVTKL